MSENGALKFVREEDFVEYFLFPKLITHCDDNESIKNNLENILKQINNVIEPLTSGHIWHKDEFNLTIRTENHNLLKEDNTEDNLSPHLYGITHYGDNIEDEWFIVYLLHEITKNIPETIGRIIDSDGEFLLIEAANVLPKWANPDTCEQRVYIVNGYLQLVQNSPTNTAKILPISQAITKIRQNPTLYKVSKEIQSSILARIMKFTDNMQDLYHYQIVKVPLAIAVLLKKKPSLIAPACRAFCERDSIDMKILRAMRYFPPENRVRTRIKFTRYLYAMLMHNSYVPDRRIGWNLPAAGSAEFKEDILGVKIACGFEILAYQAKQNDEDDISNDRSWKMYLNTLMKRGYFKNYLEGSKDYCRLLNEAKSFHKENLENFRTLPIVGREILSYLNEIDINVEQLRNEESNLSPSDSDNWLNVSSEELNEMLTKHYGTDKLCTPNGNINADEFTRNITEFLDKESEYDGIEQMSTNPIKRNKKKQEKKCIGTAEKLSIPSIVKTDEINFDPDSFQTHVKNFLDFVVPEDDWESTSEMSDYEDDKDLEKNIEDMTNTRISLKNDFQTYMNLMDQELSKTTIGKTFELTSNEPSSSSSSSTSTLQKTPTNYSGANSDDFDDIESFEPININVNTLKNMMVSYESQFGAPGPVTNLLSAMGIGVGKKSDTVNDNNTDEISSNEK